MAEDRLDRIERNLANTERKLDRFAELLDRSYHQSSERLDRIEEQTARNVQLIERNAQLIERTAKRANERMDRTAKQANERMDRTDKEIAQLSHEIRFLLAAIQGHTSQPTPPAHQE